MSFLANEEPRSRSAAGMNKGDHSWEDASTQRRSPMANDQQFSILPRQRGGTASLGIEPNNRPSKASLSSFQTSRQMNSRPSAERGVSAAVSQHRSPYPSSSKFFLTVIPPMDLPHDPPHPRSHASTSSSSHIRRGTLLPLYPTLGGQLYAISREYGLPSIGGLMLYLCDDGDGNLGPRVGDAAWSALWNRYFDESAEDLYQEITSPAPSQRTLSRGHEKRFSGASSEVQSSPYADQSFSLRRDQDGYDDSFLQETRRPSSSSKRPLASGYPASPMTYHTPSPRHLKSTRPQSRSSFQTTLSGTQARLPIVGRIEWAVDKNRAPWWSNWIGEADLSSERSVSSVITSQALGSTKRGPARRSMHLASSLSKSRTELSAHGHLAKSEQMRLDREQDHNSNQMMRQRDTTDETESDGQVGDTSSPLDSIVDVDAMGYQPIDDHGLMSTKSETEQQTFDSSIEMNGASGKPRSDLNRATSYDNQSYAGYSALLGVDDEARAHDKSSSHMGVEEPSQTRSAMDPSQQDSDSKPVDSIQHRFNANVMTESDEGHWRELQEEVGEHSREAMPDRLSARSLSEQNEVALSPKASAVHEWIAKTQSPQPRYRKLTLEDEEEEEDLLPPQDDVGDVLGLWAEKKRKPLPSPPNQTTLVQSNRSPVAGVSESGQSRLGSQNIKRTSPSSSKHSTANSPLSKHSPLSGGVARMAELPEEAPLTRQANQPTINKASLLSPIALDNSSGVFAGPSANLATLLGTRSTLGPNDEQMYSSARHSTMDSLTTPEIDTNFQSRNSLSSPRLELPSPRSPGAVSQGSSSTEASDTLLDMERALALLSPAISHNNQESPAMGTSTADSTYESGALTSAVRVKMPHVSSRESMAKARTLSTSVTPSPRWFRNTTSATPSLPKSASVGWNSLRHVSGPGVSTSGQEFDEVTYKVSPRPASAFASTKHQDRLATWNMPPPISSTRLVDNVVGAEQEGIRGEQEGQAPSPSRSIEGNGSEVKGAVSAEGHEEEGPNHGDVTTQSQATTLPRLSILEHSESAQLFDSPLEDEDSARPRWLQPREQYGRQAWSDTTGENSRMATTGDNTLHDEEEVEADEEEKGQGQEEKNPSNEVDTAAIHPAFLSSPAMHTSPSISATFSPRSNEYATVGVQAERGEGSRTESLFSLVSDDANYSTSSHVSHVEEDEDQQVEVKSNHLQTPVFDTVTPQMASQPRMAHSGTSSVDFQPSINRLIRGHSFAESSEAASSLANSPFDDREKSLQGPTMQDFDWSNFGVESGKKEAAEAENNDATIQQNNDNLSRSQSAAGDDVTTMRGGVTNESSSRTNDGEEWSQSGSEYEDDGTTGSPATRVSRYSHQIGADAGGRTPTFYYDSHLTDDEPASRRASKRMSGNRRASKNTLSQRISRPSLRPTDVQDALGVGMSPPNQATVSQGQDHDGLSVVDNMGNTSFDSNRHDVISLAGEMINSNDDRMLSGFERVSHPQVVVNNKSAGYEDNGDTQEGSTNKAVDIPSTRLSTMTTHNSKFASPLAKNAGSSLRRSMGSIREDRRDNTSQARRASASATGGSPGKSSLPVNPSASPRRFRGAMLRLAADGSAIPSSRGISPNQRFRALPPSPSLPPTGLNGVTDPMSPISPLFFSNEATSMPSIQAYHKEDGSHSSHGTGTLSPPFQRNQQPGSNTPPSPLSQLQPKLS